jgi:hypothetical protein
MSAVQNPGGLLRSGGGAQAKDGQEKHNQFGP